MSIQQPERQLHIDLMRGFAAQLVLIGHAYSLLISKHSAVIPVETNVGDSISRLVWRFTGLFVGRGADAVIVFFVLSGLLVGASIVRQTNKNTFQFVDYFIKRTVRLQTVILPGLIISGALIWFCFQFGAGASVIEQNVPWYPADWPIQESMSFSTLACNAIFLQTIFCSQYAHNSSLWSLANEFHYYIAFPLLLVALVQSHRTAMFRFLLLTGFCAILGLWLYPYFFEGQFYRSFHFFTGALIWSVGAFLPWVFAKFPNFFRSAVSHFVWFFVASLLLYLYSKSLGATRTIAVVGLTVWLLFYAQTLNKVLSFSNNVSSCVKLFSDFSFSLYVIHVPLLFAFLSFSPTLLQKQSTSLNGFWIFLIVLIAINIFAYIFYFCFERNFPKILDRIQNLRLHT